jgi:predicted transcriptional regulator
MNNRSIVLFLTVCSAIISAVYGVLLVFSSYQHDQTLTNGIAKATVVYPFVIVPWVLSAIGWLTVGYELFSVKQKAISKALKKELSEEDDRSTLYNILKGKGGARRLAMMFSLETPKLRNEIAKSTGTNWKEVDRNIKLLSSVELVQLQFVHGSMSVYELTEKGKKVLQKVKSVSVQKGF